MHRREFLGLCTAALGVTWLLSGRDVRSEEPTSHSQAPNDASIEAAPNMPRTITLEEMRSLPEPTPDQRRRFVKHISNAHSWYKHLPLLTGGRFVVFLASDAGEGYPLCHPTLPYGNDTAGYHRAFGHLDYMYAHDSKCFLKDMPTLLFPENYIIEYSFVVYPYVKNTYYEPSWFHPEAISQLRSGAYHPERERVLEWEDVTLELFQAYRALSEEEHAIVLDPDRTPSAYIPSKGLLKYLDLQERGLALRKALRHTEIAKLERAVRLLHDLCNAN
jgi:hypothetical protein